MLKVLFWIVVLVLIVSFFGISLRSLITAPATQDNFGFLWQLLVSNVHLFFTHLIGQMHSSTASST